MENNKLVVNGENGNKVTLNVIDIIAIKELNKEYIIYTIEGDSSDNIYASIFVEDETSYTIKTIENDDEWEIVQNIINEMDSNQEGD